jgi:hypothetical protein
MKTLLLNDKEFAFIKKLVGEMPKRPLLVGIFRKILDEEESARTGVRSLWEDQIKANPCPSRNCPFRSVTISSSEP